MFTDGAITIIHLIILTRQILTCIYINSKNENLFTACFYIFELSIAFNFVFLNEFI